MTKEYNLSPRYLVWEARRLLSEPAERRPPTPLDKVLSQLNSLIFLHVIKQRILE